MADKDYFASSAISNSDIDNYLISPELFLAVKQGKYKKEETPPMKSGSIKHKMILEKEQFYEEYFIQEETASSKQKEFIDNVISARQKSPILSETELDEIHKGVYDVSKKGDGVNLAKKLANRISSEEANKKPITGAMWNAAKKAFDLINENKAAVNILNFADFREKEIYFKYIGLPCKVKIDAFGASWEEENTGIIVDLKTHERPISKIEFIQRIKEKIAKQLCYYELGLRNAEGYREIFAELKKIRKFAISVDPVCVRIYEISDETAKEESDKINGYLTEIKTTLESGDWKKEAESWILV